VNVSSPRNSLFLFLSDYVKRVFSEHFFLPRITVMWTSRSKWRARTPTLLRDASLELARSEALEGSLVARLRYLRSLEWFRTFCLCAEYEVIEFKPA